MLGINEEQTRCPAPVLPSLRTHGEASLGYIIVCIEEENKSDRVAHAYNLSTRETEAGGLLSVPGYSEP